MLYRAAEFAIALVTLFGVAFLIRTTIPVITIFIVLIFDAALLLMMVLLHRGKVQLAGSLFALIGWSCITYVMVFVHGSVTSPTLGYYILITVLCALVTGKVGHAFAGLSLATVLGVMWAEENHLLPAAFVKLNYYWRTLWYTLIFLMSVVLVHSISKIIEEAFLQASQREHELIQKNRELEDIRCSLEERVEQRTQEILREKHFFEAVFMNSPVAIVTLDLYGYVTAANPAFERMFGYSTEEVLGANLDELVADPDQPEDPFRNTGQVRQGTPVFEEGRRRRKDGSLLWVEVRGVPVTAGNLQAGMVAIYYDLTEQKRIHEELRDSEAQYRALFENVMDGVFRTTPDGRFLTANPAMVRMLGFSSMEELLACDIPTELYVNPQERALVTERQNIEGVTRNVELMLKRKDGKLIYVLENSFVVRDAQGCVMYYEGTLTDITERKMTEERLRFLATHDTLTGLPNRTFFFECLNRRIAQLEPGRRIAVLFTDLDGFKEVNDMFGHARGDALLQRVGALLQGAMRPHDMMARLGGDEFGFFFDPVDGAEHASLLAAQIQAVLAHPIHLDSLEVNISSSIGISLYPDDGLDAEILLKRADTAMYRVKAEGKNNFQLFS